MTNRNSHAPTRIRAMMITACGILLPAALVLSACTSEQPRTDETALPADTQQGMHGMEGMEGMQGMSDMSGMSAGMMSEMMSHLQMMDGARADSMQAMLPMHRQMVANMLAQMNREMRDMGMAADAEWNATVDSLRSDLTRMPEMSGQELQAMMPAHRDRMMRLMEMHRTMMSDMDM